MKNQDAENGIRTVDGIRGANIGGIFRENDSKTPVNREKFRSYVNYLCTRLTLRDASQYGNGKTKVRDCSFQSVSLHCLRNCQHRRHLCESGFRSCMFGYLRLARRRSYVHEGASGANHPVLVTDTNS